VIQSIDSPRLKQSPAPLPSKQRSQPSPEETTAPVSSPASSNPRIPNGNVRKARLERPPPLVLRRERSDREAKQSDPSTMTRPRSRSRSRSIRPTEGSSRVSVLPNPWDSGAPPSPGAFELVFFGLPSFAPPVRPANSLKAGLPRTPRETRSFQSPEVKSLEVPQFAADHTRTTFEPRRGRAP
jgi:hypothetical protein